MKNTKYSTQAAIEKLRKSDIAKALIPMEYTPGFPLLTIKSGNLCMMVPFLKYKITGEVDRTLVYPIKYVLTISVPEGVVLGFEDLAVNERFASVKFDAPVGYFRHEAIRKLDNHSYKTMRGVLMTCYDAMVAHLVEDAPYTRHDHNRFINLLNILLEPSLKLFYKALDADFANRYIIASHED